VFTQTRLLDDHSLYSIHYFSGGVNGDADAEGGHEMRRLKTMRGGVLLAMLAVLIVSACGSGGSGGATPTKTHLLIMVGGLNKQIYLPNTLTKQLGFFDQEGLDVTLIDEASGQSAEDLVLAGQVDAGSGSYNHTIELQATGNHMECVVQLDIAPGEAEMVSTKEAGRIRSMADLKGKNLGVTEIGAGTQTLTIALLHRVGITPNQVHFISVGADDTFIAAMQQGQIDAGMTTEPTISRLIASGVGQVLVDLRTPAQTQTALGGPFPFICVFMRNDYVNAHQAVVQKLVDAYVKTLQWIQSHTAQQIAAEMPTAYLAGNPSLYITALQNQFSMFSPDGKMPEGGPQSVLAIEQQTNQIPKDKPIDLSLTYTNTFVDYAGG
jgi:NitT/TauT family transport system substrate-binding protein